MKALELVNLMPLMERTSGRREVIVGLIDGPVLIENADLWSSEFRYVTGKLPVKCTHAGSAACTHGTLVAGILAAKRGSMAPAICPGCTLLVRSVFTEAVAEGSQVPRASAEELAAGIIDAIKGGARVLNLSVSVGGVSSAAEQHLRNALDHAARSGAITVVAAGNQSAIGSSVLTRHPWVIPVIACDDSGSPLASSNLGGSTGTRGLSAPGENVPSIGAGGAASLISGTSAAAAFVTGTAALLWSQFPHSSAAAIKMAVVPSRARRGRSVVPPLLDAWAAHQNLIASLSRM